MIASRTFPGYVAALLAASAVSLVSSHARAGCTTNAECGQGFECKVVGGSACVNIGCPPGQACPQSPPCEPVEIRDCVPGACAVDADCADGMVCFASTNTGECSVPPRAPCASGMPCEPPPPTTCTTTTVHMCVPRYLLPCTAASDCGTGFNCIPDPDSCWGSGSSGGGTPGTEPAPTPTPSSSGGGTDPSPPPSSTAPAPAPTGSGGSLPPESGCTPSTTNHCMPLVVDCTATSQCPAGWTCEPMGPSGDRTCAAQPLPDGGIQETCEPAPPAPVVMQCMPPYARYIQGYYADDSASGGGTLTGALPPEGQFGGPAPSPEPGSTNGETSGTPKSGAPGSASSGDTGGCQVGHGSANAGASLLALFGLIGLARRRRYAVR